MNPVQATESLALRKVRRERLDRLRLAASIVGLESPHRPEPSDYGMNAADIRDYAVQLRREGWSAWEIRARLVDPKTVAA